MIWPFQVTQSSWAPYWDKVSDCMYYFYAYTDVVAQIDTLNLATLNRHNFPLTKDTKLKFFHWKALNLFFMLRKYNYNHSSLRSLTCGLILGSSLYWQWNSYWQKLFLKLEIGCIFLVNPLHIVGFVGPIFNIPLLISCTYRHIAGSNFITFPVVVGLFPIIFHFPKAKIRPESIGPTW